jgi:hypothetical protein
MFIVSTFSIKISINYSKHLGPQGRSGRSGIGKFPDGRDHIIALWPRHFILDFIYKIGKCVNNIFVLKL